MFADFLEENEKHLQFDSGRDRLKSGFVRKTERFLTNIKRLDIASYIVEQNAVAALRPDNRVIILDMGQIACLGTAQDVCDNPDLRQGYFAI